MLLEDVVYFKKKKKHRRKKKKKFKEKISRNERRFEWRNYDRYEVITRFGTVLLTTNAREAYKVAVFCALHARYSGILQDGQLVLGFKRVDRLTVKLVKLESL